MGVKKRSLLVGGREVAAARPPWKGWLLAVVLGASFGSVLVRLVHRPGRLETTQPFLRASRISDGWMALALQPSAAPERAGEYFIDLKVDAAALRASTGISFRFVPLRDAPHSRSRASSLRVEEATLQTTDGRPVMVSGRGARLREERPFHLQRPGDAAVEGEGWLSMRLRVVVEKSRWPLALACHTGEGDADKTLPSRALVFAEARSVEELDRPSRLVTPVPIGDFTRASSGPTMTRAQLIAFLWEVGGTRGIWWGIAAMTGLFTSGVLACVRSAREKPGSAGTAALAGLGAGCLYAAWASAYALLVPPLHAPDEADHLMSFQRLAGFESLRSNLPEFARRTHFDRLRIQPWERLAPADALEPYSPSSQEWFPGDIRAEERSGLGSRCWRVFASWVPRDSEARMVLALRLCEIAVVSVAVAGAAAIAALGVGDWRAGLIGLWPVLGLPLVSILGASVSNYFLMVVAGVILAAAVIPGRVTRAGEVAATAALGLGASVAWFSSRNGLSLIGMAPMLVLPWLGAAFGVGMVTTRQIVVRWSALGVGLLLPWFATPLEYRIQIAQSLHFTGVGHRAGWIASVPYPLVILVVVTSCGVVERFLFGMRSRLSGFREGLRGTALPLACGLAMVVFATILVGPLIAWPEIRTSGRDVSAGMHVIRGWLALAGSLGFAGYDYNLWGTLWDLVGPVDVLLSNWMIRVISCSVSVGIGAALIQGARRGDHRLLAQVCVTLFSVFVVVAILLGAGRSVGFILMGRYLVVAYCVLFAISFAGWIPLLVAAARRWPGIAWTILGLVPVAIHGWSWLLILDCYY